MRQADNLLLLSLCDVVVDDELAAVLFARRVVTGQRQSTRRPESFQVRQITVGIFFLILQPK